MRHARSQVAPRTVWTVGINAGALLAVLVVLYQTRHVLTWVAVALFLALALDPAVGWLVRRKLPRGLAVAAVVALAATIVAILVATLVPMLLEQGRALVSSAPELIERLRQSSAFEWADTHAGWVDGARRELAQHASGAAGSAFRVVGGVFTGMLATITVVVLTVFMLLFGREVLERGFEWVEPAKRPRVTELARQMYRAVSGYVSGALLIAVVGGVFTTIVLLVAGVPYYLPLGLVMLVLGVVPFVGALVGGALGVGATFLTVGTKAGIATLVVFVVYQQAENHLLQPLIQRKTIKMNPLLIATVMLVGTAFAGILGALFSLPVAGAAQVVLADVLERRRARWRTGAAEAGRERPRVATRRPQPHH